MANTRNGCTFYCNLTHTKKKSIQTNGNLNKQIIKTEPKSQDRVSPTVLMVLLLFFFSFFFVSCHSVDTAHFRDAACWKYFAGVLFNQVFRPQCWELGRPRPRSRILPTHPTCIFTVIASQTCYSATKCLKILLELLDVSPLCELTDCSVVL